jgi:ATP-dependent Lon protease
MMHRHPTAIYPVISLFKVVIHPRDIATLKLEALPNRNALFSINIPDGVLTLVFYPSDAPSSGLPTEPPLPVAVLARVLSRVTSGPHQEDIIVQGLRRVLLHDVIHHNETYHDGPCPFDRGIVSEIYPEPPTQHHFNLITEVLRLYEQLSGSHPRFPKDKLLMLQSYQKEPEYFVDLITQTAKVDRRQTIAMMREVGVIQRLELILEWMQGEVEQVQIDHDLDRKAKLDIESSRHEYHLRQKMKMIRRELGEDDHSADEADRYTEQLEALDLSHDTQQEVKREIERLRNIQPSSSEFQVIKTFLDRFFALPWGIELPESIELPKVRHSLEEEHFGLEKVKERILEFLAVRKLNPDHKGPILCFAGPPGVGKTSLGQAIAESIGRKFFRISVGGISDEAEVRGHRRTYVGAMPGKIMNALTRSKCQNPLLMLDEIDKIGSDHRGDPASALLEVLDPEQNSTFTDHYFNVPFDLSKIMFIVTANYLHDIPKPLLDRLEVITIEGYTESEKVELAQRHLLPKVIKDHGLIESPPSITKEGLSNLIRYWTREAGVRSLKRNLQKVCRKVALERIEEERIHIEIGSDIESLNHYLGPKQYQHSEGVRDDLVGVANGLAWTATGGELLVIEAIKMKGTGKLIITGKLGDVMKESVRAAHSFVRARAELLGIEASQFDRDDLHIHFPAGAVPKDGPSAGVTVTLAIASLLSQRSIRSDFAMTGEVTLRGQVLPVGGIKDKVLAAYRAGILHLALPQTNAKDLVELPQEVRDEIQYHLIDHVDDLLALALLDPLTIDETSELVTESELLDEMETRQDEVTSESSPHHIEEHLDDESSEDHQLDTEDDHDASNHREEESDHASEASEDGDVESKVDPEQTQEESEIFISPTVLNSETHEENQ